MRGRNAFISSKKAVTTLGVGGYLLAGLSTRRVNGAAPALGRGSWAATHVEQHMWKAVLIAAAGESRSRGSNRSCCAPFWMRPMLAANRLRSLSTFFWSCRNLWKLFIWSVPYDIIASTLVNLG